MFTRVRGSIVALVIGALLLGQAAPAAAANMDDFTREHDVPVLLDAMILRPIGLVMTGIGVALAGPTMGIVAITHPPSILEPVKALVVPPVRYTFLDPIGQH